MNFAAFMDSGEAEIIELGTNGTEAPDEVKRVGVQFSERYGLKVSSGSP